MTSQCSLQHARKNMPKLLPIQRLTLYWSGARNGNWIWMLTTVRYVPFPLGAIAVLDNLLSSLVLRKFGSTPLLVFSVSSWTEALRLTQTWRSWLRHLSSLRIIRATAHTSWGWHRSTLKMAFYALIRSKFDYAAPAWQHWLSAANLPCLDRLQNHSICLIAGILYLFWSWRSELPHMQQPVNLKS